MIMSKKIIITIAISALSTATIAANHQALDNKTNSTHSSTSHKIKHKTASDHNSTKPRSSYNWSKNFNGSQVGLGGSINTGDTSSRALNTQAQIKYTHKRWKDFANFQMNYGKSNNTISQEKYEIENQLWYFLNKKQSNFLAWGITDTIDKLNSYSYEATSSLSLGHEIYHTDKIDWTAQAGPGMRRTKNEITEQVQNHFISHGQSTLIWKITPATSVSETITANIGKPFNKFVSKASLTNKLMAHLATSLSFETAYYSSLPINSTRNKKWDTITQLNLVYSF